MNLKKEKSMFLYDENCVRLQLVAKFWMELQKKYDINNRDLILLMASNDTEINYYSVLFLNALKNEKNYDRLFIMADNENMEMFAKMHATVPFEFIKCTHEQSCDLRWMYSIYRFTDQLLINSFEYAADTDAMGLIGHRGLSKKDIVAIAFLKMEKVPAEDEILRKCRKFRINYRAIDWDKVEKTIVYANDTLTKQHEFYDAGLDPVLSSGLISKNDPIVLFGISKVTMYVLKKLQDYNVVAIIDNNTQKSGQYIKNVPIYYPEEYLQEYDSNVKILVPSICYKDMCEQLYYMGYEIGKQVFIVHCQNYLLSASEKSVNSVLHEVSSGYVEYERLREKYKMEYMFLCPYPGTGDVYLVGLYIESILKRYKISKYVLLVVSKNCEKVASLFDMNVECITQDVAKYLLMYSRFIGFDNVRLKVLNDGYLQRMVPRLRGYAGVDFHTMFRKVVFGIEDKSIYPKWNVVNADEIFIEHNLKKGRTILLSPYANTVYKISLDFWEKLAFELKKQGYDVCTNCSSDIEEPVEGTIGLFVPYNQMVDFINKAYGFVAIRSGLCDIVSSATSRMVIFYPEGKTLLNSSTYDYFSLNKMGLANGKTLELEFAKGEEYRLFEKVMDFLVKGEIEECK